MALCGGNGVVFALCGGQLPQCGLVRGLTLDRTVFKCRHFSVILHHDS